MAHTLPSIPSAAGTFIVRPLDDTGLSFEFSARIKTRIIHRHLTRPRNHKDVPFSVDGTVHTATTTLDGIVHYLQVKLAMQHNLQTPLVPVFRHGGLGGMSANLIDLVPGKELLALLARILPDLRASNQCNYLHQILTANDDCAIVRGMAPNTAFLFELRNDLIDGTLERNLNKELAKMVGAATMCGRQWSLDKAAFASIYLHVLSQMDQLTPHQRAKLETCQDSDRSHITGPAGCGKTFIALYMVLDLLTGLALSGKILFVAKNEALGVFFINWVAQRLRKTPKMKWSVVKRTLAAKLRVLHSSPFADTVYGLKFESDGGIRLVPQGGEPHTTASYDFIVVDEAHHIFDARAPPDDRELIMKLCSETSRSLLLSDISQGGATDAIVFPPKHTTVLLTEVVRNSSRIVAASLPFCRSEQLAAVKCQHGVRGPPLVPFVFDNCGSNGDIRFEHYVKGIISGLQHIIDAFPGAELHDQLVILVPDSKFKERLQTLLERAVESAFSDTAFQFVTAVIGAYATPRRNKTRTVLDTLQSFDGMERLFVLAVGLDSVRTAEGCCGIYRAITRAHMFVCVVQEHLPGGWLEFTAKVELDSTGVFDEALESDRVKRDNLAVLAKESKNESENDEIALAAADTKMVVIDNNGDPNQHDEDVSGSTTEVDPAVVVVVQNVWQSNTSAFSAEITQIGFNPLKLTDQCATADDDGFYEVPEASPVDGSPVDNDDFDHNAVEAMPVWTDPNYGPA
jgi:hypothetical protein